MRRYLKKAWLKQHGTISFIDSIGSGDTGRWMPFHSTTVLMTSADSPVDGLYDTVKEMLYERCEK